MSSLSAQNKTVVVSGCSSGIGRCAALTLAARGYRVIATVRNEADRETLLQDIPAKVVLLDLADSASVDSAADDILEYCGGSLYALFNNAAYGQPGAVEDLSRDALRRQFEVNVFGTHQFTCRLLPALLAHGDARIVQNSSILGFISMPMRGAYNASKHALEGLSDTLRMELVGSGVSVSIIQPGPIVSRFRQNALRALERHVDFSNSRHAEGYRQALVRLSKPGPASSYTMPPEAVVSKLIHALEAKRPRARYRVTLPTRLLAILKPLLPTSRLDKILLGAAESREG